MARPKVDFPPVRACIFDLDGLLINTEDIITQSINELLTKYNRPTFTRALRAQLMGVPDSTSGDAFHSWARLPISREEFARESREHMRFHFPRCEPLRGAEELLAALGRAGNTELALASTTKSESFNLKVARPETRRLLARILPSRRVLGDVPRVGGRGKGKPAPDLYLLALEIVNSELETSGRKPIRPDECLVFEDSVIGVEAGRRAGMRVIWVPHPDVALEYQGREGEVLAGRIGIVEVGDDWQLGEVDDGWAETIPSLEHFDYQKYGIDVPP
ncbi:hypothetical protein M426DRAFT_321490 [Hypoxylon sp. CI-4A]|nr:hypothetical protein M426DRAFT_321490 [Hypoxylon sp. CI-4A]